MPIATTVRRKKKYGNYYHIAFNLQKTISPSSYPGLGDSDCAIPKKLEARLKIPFSDMMTPKSGPKGGSSARKGNYNFLSLTCILITEKRKKIKQF